MLFCPPTLFFGSWGIYFVSAYGVIAVIVFISSLIVYGKSFFTSIWDIMEGIKLGPGLFLILVILFHIYTWSYNPVEGVVTSEDGKFFVENHGEIVHYLTFEEYKVEYVKTGYRILAHFFVFFAFGQVLLMKDKLPG